VLENRSVEQRPGWLLHFDGTLAQKKIPGRSAGRHASIVPAAAVPRMPASRISADDEVQQLRRRAGRGEQDAVLDPNTSMIDRSRAAP